jgi:RimJ/RimL family protein N-acetyltransferase
MELRALTAADTDAYRRVRLRALAEHPEFFGRALEEAETAAEMAEQLRSRHDGTESFILGAFEEALVGIAGCSRDRPAKHRHKALIWGMYVTPEARGRGVGRALLEAAVARAGAWAGVEQLLLAVAAHNEAALALYLSCGFEVYGVERRALKVRNGYVDEANMVRFLGGGSHAGG